MTFMIIDFSVIVKLIIKFIKSNVCLLQKMKEVN